MRLSLTDRITKKKWEILLIIIVSIIGTVLYKDFLVFKKIYIFKDSGGDTLISYWPYYNHMTSLIKEGKFMFWDFQNGLGNNVFARPTDLLDPFNLIFYFIKTVNIPYALGYIALLKVILAGIFFWKYISNFKYSKYTNIIVSILYAFNGYIMLWGQHYAFATIMVFLPLLLDAYEKWFLEHKWLYFVSITAVIAAFSIYFFYMISIYLFVYALFRYLLEREFKIKDFIKYFLTTMLYYILGIALSAAILFPSINVLFLNPRIGSSNTKIPILKLDLLINYVAYIERLFSNNIIIKGKLHYDAWWYNYESPILYCGILTLILIPQIFSFVNNKTKKIYSVFIGIFATFTVFPFFSYMMNGFSVGYYRWTFIIIVFELYLLATVINNIDNENIINTRLLIETSIFLLILPILTLLYGSYRLNWNSLNVHLALNEIKKVDLFIIAYTAIIYLIKFKRFRNISKVFILVIVCIEVTNFSSFSINNRDLLEPSYIKHEGYYDSTNEAITYIKSIDNDIYRIDKSYVSQSYSEAYMQNYYGVKAYDSSNSPNYTKFLKVLDVKNGTELGNFITGFGDRTKLQTLSSVKYYIAKDNDFVPFGYKLIKRIPDLNIYENVAYLPLGYTYDSYIRVDDFNNLNWQQKDETLLNAFVYEGKNKELDKYNEIHGNVYYKGSTIKNLKKDNLTGINVDISTNEFPTMLKYKPINGDPMILVPVKGCNPLNGNNGVEINMNIQASKNEKLQIYWRTEKIDFKEENSKTITLEKSNENCKVNINVPDINYIRIDLGQKERTCTINDFEMTVVPNQSFDKYDENIKKLKDNALKIEKFKGDYISGSILVDEDKLLCLSIPYDKGWSLKVDGKKANIETVNIGFIGVFLQPGYHKIELSFIPPLLIAGIFVSLICIILITFMIFYQKKSARQNKL